MRSLLKLDTTTYGKVINAIHDLQIDALVRIIFTDTRKKDKVLEILESVLTDEETIVYRQNILKDLMYDRTMFETLMKECTNMEKCYAEYDGNRSIRSKIKMKSDVSIADISTSLRDYAYTFKKLIEIYTRLDTMFKEHMPSSKGLKTFYHSIHKRITNEAILKLLDIFDKIINSGQAYGYVISLDDYLVPVESKYIIYNGKYEGEKFSLFKKKNITGRIDINEKVNEDSRRIVMDSYNRTVTIIEEIFETLFTEISYIASEIVFYEFAIKLYDVLGEKNETVVFPVYSDKTNYQKVKDPYLITRYQSEGYGDMIYGNNISLQKSECALVIGSNNTGKTVFIRTIGICQILAQNGLFVPAEEFTFTIKDKIVSIFSGEEKDTNVGGRFEKEVIDIKEVIDQVDENSLVIINEIFQSTFAEDGKNALLDILRFFTEINVKWITVTHLIKDSILKDPKYKEYLQDVKMYKTTSKEEKYRINEINII